MEDFEREWNRSSSLNEVADRLGMKPDTAAHKAVRLRRLGVELKSLRKDLDYAQTNRFVESIRAGTAALTIREFALLYEAGVPLKVIAKIKGCSVNAVAVSVGQYRRCGLKLSVRKRGRKKNV